MLAYIRTIPDGTSLAFIFGDINGLKKENDTKGHAAGDRLIQRSAAVLVEAADSEHVFRMGGDEFLLIVEDKTAQEAATILRKLQATCAERRLSVALGCTVKTTPLASIDAVLSETDALMYENKRRMHQHQAQP